MTSKGCSYKDGRCYPVVEQCEGCERIKEFSGEKYCLSFPEPAVKWVHKACNFATHVKAVVDNEGKVKVNPLKASKRAARGR
ncbi:MAG: PxxKW family cysteine-rich protein [Desulfonauticus sp.]|nr:PxxKW family cysteine-rich protein [Desulfonauticus sp.]